MIIAHHHTASSCIAWIHSYPFFITSAHNQLIVLVLRLFLCTVA